MKRSRFSDEQIIGILKEHQAGLPAAELCPQVRDQRPDLLHLAQEIRRHRSVGGQAAEGS